MKKFILTFTFCLFLLSIHAQTRHVISSSGLEYTPDSLVVMVGDTIEFDVGASHPTTQVSQSTWQSNGTNSNGGFDFSNGQGEFVVQNQGTLYYVCVNHVSSGMKGRIFAMPSIGNDEKALSEFQAYPNPVQDFLFLNMPVQPEVETAGIYNLKGQLVKAIALDNISGPLRVNTSQLQEGIYILQIKNGNTARQIRFVKK